MQLLPQSLRDALSYPAMPALESFEPACPAPASRPRRRPVAHLLMVSAMLVGVAACAVPGRRSLAPVPAPSALVDWRAGMRGLAVLDPTLDAHIRRMRAWSPAFDSAMAEVERSPVPVVIGTDEQLRAELPGDYAASSGWEALQVTYPRTWAHAPGRPIQRAAVIVRLATLRGALGAPGDSLLFDRSLETVLAHEIYGHLVPQLRLGRTKPIACADERDGSLPFDACVVRREQAVVSQLNVTRYALRRTAPATVVAAGGN